MGFDIPLRTVFESNGFCRFQLRHMAALLFLLNGTQPLKQYLSSITSSFTSFSEL